MNIPYFRMILLEFRASADHIVQQIPKLRLEEETIYLSAVLDLDLEDIWEVIVC